MAVGGVEVVAEPGQVQGDLVGDLGRADAADGGVEVASGPGWIASGAARPSTGGGTTFCEGNLRRSGRELISVTWAVMSSGCRLPSQ